MTLSDPSRGTHALYHVQVWGSLTPLGSQVCLVLKNMPVVAAIHYYELSKQTLPWILKVYLQAISFSFFKAEGNRNSKKLASAGSDQTKAS